MYTPRDAHSPENCTSLLRAGRVRQHFRLRLSVCPETHLAINLRTQIPMMGARAVSTLMLWQVAMVTAGNCDNKPIASKCCKDGAPDYVCGTAQKCGRGQCIATAAKLCTDASSDYVCGTSDSCGRGVCIPITSTLCGTSGSTICAITQTCCGATAASKNSDMVCNTMMDTCPADRKSDTYTSPMPYIYSPGGSSSDSAAASLGSGALGTTLLAVATAALLRGLLF